jgi:hypothetical protein
MEITASRFKLRANAPEGRKAISYQPGKRFPISDTFTPQWMSKEVAAAIPGADLHLYDNAGHAFHWECLNDFNPRTTEWLLKHCHTDPNVPAHENAA